LTYSGEFDRVHYPLPLGYEDPLSPDIASWKRTINRLRKQVRTKNIGPSAGVVDDELAGAATLDKDKDRDSVRHIVTQLRQDNTELRHRLRQADSRANNVSSIGKGGSTGGGFTLHTDLVNENIKLRKQLSGLKKELADTSNVYEKFKIESYKEVNILKAKVRLSENKTGSSLFDNDSGMTFIYECICICI
jgi:thiamine kinase-like enzyme